MNKNQPKNPKNNNSNNTKHKMGGENKTKQVKEKQFGHNHM